MPASARRLVGGTSLAHARGRRGTTRLHGVAALVAGLVVLSLAPAVATPAQAPGSSSQSRQAAQRGSLTYSPQVAYVAGQALSFTGRLGTNGQRRIKLQQHMNRPGDRWFPVRGFKGRTAADGSFSFSFPAPAMFGIRYRVVGKGGHTSAPVRLNAKAQDLTLRVAGNSSDVAVAGEPFTVEVDTTPSLVRRPETAGLPVFGGRALTLQRRIAGDRWDDVGTAIVQGDGMGYFHGVSAPTGTVVYRAVQAEITSGANRIGWQQSFPMYVTVVDQGARVLPPLDAAKDSRQPASRVDSMRASTGAGGSTASSRYGWYPALYDFTWESGQSLTSPPDSGSVRTGWWLDYADGAGRVSRQNGGLYLDSQRSNAGGRGDFGTTRATLRDASQTYGRWEARLRLKSAESSSPDFKVLAELVPDRPEDYACGKRNITLAEVAAHSSTMTFGAKADTKQWTGTRKIASLIHSQPAVAVEVARGHITWFWEGKPIGTVKGRSAVSDVPMTLRFSMVGDQGTERNQTGVVSDWQRGFGIASGKQVRSGPRLRSSSLSACES